MLTIIEKFAVNVSKNSYFIEIVSSYFNLALIYNDSRVSCRLKYVISILLSLQCYVKEFYVAFSTRQWLTMGFL